MFEVLLFVSVGTVLGLGAALRARLSQNEPEIVRHRGAIRRQRTYRISDAQDGARVRIDGEILDGELLKAPLTGRACVYYISVVEELTAGQSAWRERGREIRSVPFLIDDGTGRAIVEPTHARIDAAIDRFFGPDAAALDPRGAAAFLARRGVSAERQRGRVLRYVECTLEVGERIAILGRGVREPDPEAIAKEVGYREAAPHRLRFGGTEREPLLVSNARTVTGEP